MTTKELDALAEEHIRSHGGTPSFLGYHGFTGSLCTSVNDEIVHGIPGDRVLDEGDLLSVDCGAIVAGWHGDAARTLVVGDRAAASPAVQRLSEVTEAAMWAGIAALSVDGRLHDVGGAVEDAVRAAGRSDRRDYGIVEDFVGHGIGREMHMAPNVPNYRVAGKGPLTPVGTTIAIEPMITLGDQDNRNPSRTTGPW